jgi:sirohydrochlorin cobaltochelatase
VSSGILLVGHGTRNDVGAAECLQLADALQAQQPDQPVEACFLELRPPTIAEAWGRLAAAGVARIHVAPLLLFAAGHAKRDVPLAIADCAAETPGIAYDFARPLSRHPRLIDLAVERVAAALAASPHAPEATALVAVGRGSYDPCAQADMRVFGALLGHRLPVGRTETAFYAMAEPRLPQVLDRLAADPAIEAIIVQPHLLFQGQVRDAVQRQVDEAAERHRRIAFQTLPHLGPDPRVAAALVGRLGTVTAAPATSLQR